MSLDNVRRALESVRDYPGVVGIMGGNPCLHPQFAEICELVAEILPDKSRRGIWSNNVNGHGWLVRRTFGYFNLNVHGNKRAAEEMRETVPGVQIWGEAKPSLHGGILLSLSELVPDEEAQNQLISSCDINQRWSPAVAEINGRLAGYFCEIAAAFAAVNNDVSGVAVHPGWWRQPMADFAADVDAYCSECGVPLRVPGRADSEKTDDMSPEYAARLQKPGRGIVIHTEAPAAARELTDYQGLRG